MVHRTNQIITELFWNGMEISDRNIKFLTKHEKNYRRSFKTCISFALKTQVKLAKKDHGKFRQKSAYAKLFTSNLLLHT